MTDGTLDLHLTNPTADPTEIHRALFRLAYLLLGNNIRSCQCGTLDEEIYYSTDEWVDQGETRVEEFKCYTCGRRVLIVTRVLKEGSFEMQGT